MSNAGTPNLVDTRSKPILIIIRLDNARIVNSNSIRLRTILSRTFHFLRIVFSFRRGRKMDTRKGS
ncbi:hypothetical protein LEP1GSC050_2681 [Leptospira broomii serovar Hurstbridge str. 5399]|uniref:Uncharacterized protein n=1 Tax=Leptospira broomii serovar Hurstbridge str. 5399 TaxID=1049789 RepID=T0F915_9LEPT|nr:hypothetical protein LEP1GSC050_2681 [Leptospira broomii serovar Hurstbridge str. 5399]